MQTLTIPTPTFEFAGKFPLVTAKIDGERKSFLLDNGVPTLVLNSIYDNGESTPAQVFTASGEQQNIQTKFITSFEWGDLRQENQLALIMDLSRYEKDANTTIHGIIGGAVLMNQDLLLNYPKKQAGLISLPDNPPHLMDTVAPGMIGEYKTIPFQMAHHLPIVPLKIGEKVLNMALYMGVCVNILNEAHREYIQQLGALTGETPAKLLGLTTEKQLTAYALPSAIVSPHENISMPFMKFAFDNIEIPGANIDGMLGYELFSKMATIIRFNGRELLLGN